MELVVRKSDLLRELQLFQGIVERNNTIPVLANVLMEAEGEELRFLATDLQVALRSKCAASVSKPGRLTLPAKKLFEIIRVLPETEIRIEQDKSGVKVIKQLEKTLAARPRLLQEHEDATQLAETRREALRTTEAALHERQGARQQLFLAAGSPGEPESARADLARAAEGLRKAIADEEARQRRIEAEAAGAREALASGTAAWQETTSRLGQLEERVAALAADLDAVLTAAGFASADDARRALLPEAQAARLERELREHDRELDATRGALASSSQALEGKRPPDLKALAEEESGARTRQSEARAALQATQHALQAHRAAAGRWAELLQEGEDLRRRGAVFLELSEDLNGLGREGRAKLSFASFVLGRWLRLVLEQGSLRLSALSGGRYRFLHNDLGSDGRKRSGLEIDVHDAHAGGVRGVGSLSGGEKFLASLSLALGLSDVIQAHAGGRRLDALFIDEGFGSLDGLSLDRVIEVLNDVGEDRQVGIRAAPAAFRAPFHRAASAARAALWRGS